MLWMRTTENWRTFKTKKEAFAWFSECLRWFPLTCNQPSHLNALPNLLWRGVQIKSTRLIGVQKTSVSLIAGTTNNTDGSSVIYYHWCVLALHLETGPIGIRGKFRLWLFQTLSAKELINMDCGRDLMLIPINQDLERISPTFAEMSWNSH